MRSQTWDVVKLILVLTLLACVLVLLRYVLRRKNERGTTKKKRKTVIKEGFFAGQSWIAFYNDGDEAWFKFRANAGFESKYMDYNDKYNRAQVYGSTEATFRDKESYKSGGKEVKLGPGRGHNLDDSGLKNKLSSILISGQNGSHSHMYVRMSGLKSGNNEPGVIEIMEAYRMDWDNKIDKCEVHGPIGITLFEHDNFRGWSFNILPGQGLVVLPDDRRSKASSFKVFAVAPPPPPPPPPPPGAPPRIQSWMGWYNEESEKWIKFHIYPGMQIPKFNFDNKYNTVTLMGDASSVTVRNKDHGDGDDNKEKLLIGRGPHYMRGHDLENNLSSVMPTGQNGAMSNRYVRLSGLKSSEVRDYPDQIDIMEAYKLGDWDSDIDRVTVVGNVEVQFWDRQNYGGEIIFRRQGGSDGLLDPSHKGRASSFKVVALEDVGKSEESTTNYEGVDWVEFHDEDRGGGQRIRLRTDGAMRVGHIQLDNTYNQVILQGSAVAVELCKKNRDNTGNASECTVVRTKGGPVTLWGGNHELSSVKILEPTNNSEGAWVTLTGKKSSGKKMQPDSIDVIYADKLDWDDAITHVSIKGKTTVKFWHDKFENDGDLNEDDKSAEFTGSIMKKVVPTGDKYKYKSFKVITHTEGQAEKPEEADVNRNEAINYVEIRDTVHDRNQTLRMRFRPTTIGHLAMDDAYNRVKPRGTTTKFRVCKKDLNEINDDNQENECQIIDDSESARANGVEVFEGQRGMSSVEILEPKDDPNAFVTLTGKKSGLRMQPVEIDVFHADKLHWDRKITNLEIQGKMRLKLFTGKASSGDHILRVDTQSDFAIPRDQYREHRSIQIDGMDQQAELLQDKEGVSYAYVENPYVQFIDRDGETEERFRFTPVSMDSLNLDNTYNTIILKGSTQGVAVSRVDWDEIHNEGEWQTDNNVLQIRDKNPAGVKMWEGRYELSALRVIDDGGDASTAYVTLTGRHPSKTTAPESIDVYFADKLNWDKKIDGIELAGYSKLHFFNSEAGGGNNSIPAEYTQTQSTLSDERRRKFRRMIVIETQQKPLEPGQEGIDTDTNIVENNVEVLNNVLDITLVDKDNVETARWMIRNQLYDMNLDNMYNTVTLSSNCARVLVCKKNLEDMLGDNACYDNTSGVRKITENDTDCCNVLFPMPKPTGIQRTFLLFNGEHELSYVKIFKKDEKKPAWVRLSGRHPDADNKIPAWFDVIHADKMGWGNKYIATIQTHNRSAYFYSRKNYDGDVFNAERQSGPITVKPERKFNSVSMFPKFKIDADLIKPPSKFVKIVDDNDRELLFEPTFAEGKNLMHFSTFHLKRKYKKLRLINGCTKARITYGITSDDNVTYRLGGMGASCMSIGDGWGNVMSAEECLVGMDNIGMYYQGKTPNPNSEAPVGCSVISSTEDDDSNDGMWYFNTVPSEENSSQYQRVCKMSESLEERVEIIFDESVVKDIANDFNGNIIAIEVMNDGADYYLYGSGGVELFDPVDETVPQSIIIRRATDLAMSTTIRKIHTSTWNVSYGEELIEIPKDREIHINKPISWLVVFSQASSSFVQLKLNSGNKKAADDVLIFDPPNDIHNLDFTSGNATVYNKFTWHNGATEVSIIRGVDGRVEKHTRDPENKEEEVRASGGIAKIEVTKDGADGYLSGQGYVQLIRDSGAVDRPLHLNVRKATRFNWRNMCIEEETVDEEQVESDADPLIPPENDAEPLTTPEATTFTGTVLDAISSDLEIDNDSNKPKINVSGSRRNIVFYDSVYGESTRGKEGITRLEYPDISFDTEVVCDKMASMYTDKQQPLKTAFLKKDHGNPANREYINFVVDKDIPHLGLNKLYTQFRFKGGARKVQICDDRWEKVKFDCYTKFGPAQCDKCDTYTWDPKDQEKIYNIDRDLVSMRVYDDGYQGYDEHMGYLEVMGKKADNPGQPESVLIRNADRMDWNDDPDWVFTPNAPLTFYQHQNKGGDSYHHGVSDNIQRRLDDNYSSMYTHVTQACEKTNQECMACNDENDAMCKGEYSSAEWRERYFRDDSTNHNGGFDGKCVDNQCVACNSDDDCLYGYQCCLPGSCDKWSNKIYGACHRPH